MLKANLLCVTLIMTQKCSTYSMLFNDHLDAKHKYVGIKN